MDSYAEQIVKKAGAAADNSIRIGIMLGGFLAGILIIVLFGFFKLGIVGAFLGVGALYGGYYLSAEYDVEYEYLIVNGELDIDKILAKKRRKKMIMVNVSEFEDFGVYSDENSGDDNIIIVSAVGDDQALNIYYADFNHETYGKCRLLFTPSNKILCEIKPYLKGKLKQVLLDLKREEDF